MSGRFISLALVANAALAAVLAAMWLGPQGALRHTVWHVPQPQPSNLNEVVGTVLVRNPALQRAYPEITQRPLFTNDRRPVVPEEAPSPQEAAPPPIALDQIVLSGIVAGPRFTGVMAQVDGQQRLLKPGDTVGDWILERIDDRDVRFTRNGELRVLTLKSSLLDEAVMQQGAKAVEGALQPLPPQARRGAPRANNAR